MKKLNVKKDDTVVIITRDPAGGSAMAETLLGLHSS